jgi:hypothetical protein
MKRTLMLLFLGFAAVGPQTAAASVSVAAGGYTQSAPSSTGAAVILSSGASIPQIPLEVQVSLLLPLGRAGGYAATAEIRGFTGGGYGGAYIGAGAGVGNLSSDRSSGTVFTAFAGKSIAPLTSVEIRFYKEMQSTGATAGFIGLRLSF